MNSQSWQFIRLGLAAIVALLVVSCTTSELAVPDPAFVEPAAAEVAALPTATPLVITAVVTATEPPPTPEPVIVTVLVTPTAEAEAEVVAAVANPDPAPEAIVEAAAPEAADDQGAMAAMSLSAQKARTEYSPRPDPFVEPASLDDIAAPPESSWRTLEPGDMTEFQTYDGVRVTEAGEALLDLGDLMRLLLKRDTVTQFVSGELVEEEMERIAVEFPDTPLLQRIALALHLSRGGFLGEKSIDSGPIALSTPNAVIIVSGTTFFLVYDPDAEITWVGKFEGTLDVADVALREGEGVPDRQLLTIPAVRGRKFWPLHNHLTPEEFIRLIDLLESPIAAVDMISGPYLIGVYDPEIAVRSGPGTEFSTLGRLARDQYARIIGKGRGWWQIECPRSVIGPTCWVSGGTGFTKAYNTDIVDIPVTALPPTPIPTPTPKPVPKPAVVVPRVPDVRVPEAKAPDVQVPPGVSPGDVFNCSYVGRDQFEWYSVEGGPFTGIWQSGCPASPKITIDGCSVRWEAGNDEVTSAKIRIQKSGYAYSRESNETTEEFTASLPDGSQSFELPYGFDGTVTAYFDITLENGTKESKKTSRNFDAECYPGGYDDVGG